MVQLKSATHWPVAAAQFGEISRDRLLPVWKFPHCGKWREREEEKGEGKERRGRRERERRESKLPPIAPNAGSFLFSAAAYCTHVAGWGAGSIKE